VATDAWIDHAYMRKRASLIVYFMAGTALCACQSANSIGIPRYPVASASGTDARQYRVFTAGETPGFLGTARASGVAPGANGTIWFTDGTTPAIGRISADGTIQEFTAGLQAGSEPFAIRMGPDGNMWFSDREEIAIGKITPSGTISEYTNDKNAYTPSGQLTFDTADRPWTIASKLPAALGHLTAREKVDVEPVPAGFTPDGTLAGDADGSLWYTGYDRAGHALLFGRSEDGGKTLRLPIHEVAASVPCCPNQAADPMAIGPTGEPWFTTMLYVQPGSAAQYVAALQNGKVLLLRLAHRGLTFQAYPSGIAASSNTMWVSGSDPFENDGALWHIDAQRKQTVYPLPFNPISLAIDSSGNPWLTAGFIGQPSQIVEVLGTK
jgi:sugar lactone lactonase YvrE